MAQCDSSDDALGRYNLWSHRRPLICHSSEDYGRATSFFARSDLSPSEQAAYYFHELTGCAGLEFVAFSNVRLEGQMKLPNGVTLAACFLDKIECRDAADPLVQSTLEMQMKSRFIYDGWVPIVTWNDQHVRRAIEGVDEALSVFSLSGRIYFDWEPKYLGPHTDQDHSAYVFDDAHYQQTTEVSKALDGLGEKDRMAVYRSLAWLSQGIRLTEPAARFLFSILAIESLATYIEDKAPEGSRLTVLRVGDIMESERDARIKAILAEWLEADPRKAIEKAYFEGVTSITRKLKRHLQNALGSDPESYNLLFVHRVEGRTLYDLRHYIAHGEVNALSDAEKGWIRSRIWDAEKAARRYIWAVLTKALQIRQITNRIQARAFVGPDRMAISHEVVYKGPTHMAIVYSR